MEVFCEINREYVLQITFYAFMCIFCRAPIGFGQCMLLESHCFHLLVDVTFATRDIY